jgi:hypothetical protein
MDVTENTNVSPQSTRKAISKSIRFEVFKRDSFKCQYCGASAPDVLLHIDHIQPVVKGGDNDILNLITACIDCNSGKSDKLLSETSAVAKRRGQLEGLQERREQLEMMLAWMEDLRELNTETLDGVVVYWQQLAPGFTTSQNGRNDLRQWIRKFSVQDVYAAMDVAAEQYLRFTKRGTVTLKSWGIAFGKIPGICRVERESAKDPDLKSLYYIRGILRNRLEGRYCDENEALAWLRAARSWSVSIENLRRVAQSSSSWTQFRNGISDEIEEQKKLQALCAVAG